MLTYNLEKRGEQTLYGYLYECIRSDILCGRILPNEKLPSKRTLAKNMEISVKTVENAYEQLLVEGYVRAEEKRGYFVNAVEGRAAGNKSAGNPADGNMETGKEADMETGINADRKAGIKTDMKVHGGNGHGKEEWFADFTSNYKVYEKFPFSTWAKIMRETLSYHDMELLEMVPTLGIEPLREEIAKHLYEFRGMEVSPQQIVVGAGTEYLYGRLIQLLGRDGIYALENPGYLKMTRLYKNHGLSYRYVDIDGNGIRLDALRESGANVVHVSPGHHFPVGFVMPVARRQELLNWAGEERGRYIIEDDYDSEFRLNVKPVPAMQTLDTDHRVIYLNTFSRTLFPSVRVGYMVLPPKLVERYLETVSFYSCSVSAVEQYALASFMEKGYFERHIRRVKLYYKEKRDGLLAELKRTPLWGKCTLIEENAGTRFLLRVDTPLTDSQIKWCAAGRGLNLSCLSEYCKGQTKETGGILLISYGDIPKGRMREAVGRLSAVFG